MTRENVNWTLARMAERVGNEYVYGGQFDPADINVGCDCSALVAFVLNGVLYGNRATFRRVDAATGAWITTESWRPVEVGEVGPFGTICVARPEDIPADAAVRIALHHGPGGGAASHTWCEVDGHRFESNGSRGCVTDPDALRIDASYANDWAYLPGPIDRLEVSNNGTAPPAGREPTNDPTFRLGSGATGPSVIALQIGLGRVFPAYAGSLAVSGVYDAATIAAVAEFQRRTLSEVSGIVDAATRDLLGHYGINLPDPSAVTVGASVVTPEPVSPPPIPAPVSIPDMASTIDAAVAEHEANNPDPAQTVINYPAPEPPAPHRELLDTITTALAALASLLDR